LTLLSITQRLRSGLDAFPFHLTKYPGARLRPSAPGTVQQLVYPPVLFLPAVCLFAPTQRV